MQAWTSPQWRALAVRWLDEQLRGHAIERTGAVTQPRVRPWATVLTAPTTAGPVWLKATAPDTAFEVPLYRLLHRVVPDRVLAPLAADPARGWILLPDGGPSLGSRLAGPALVDALVRVLPEYGRLQCELAGHAVDLLRIGVLDMRPAVLPERFEQALAIVTDYAATRASAADRQLVAELAARRPAVVTWCKRLTSGPGVPSLDHNDLHARNILGDPARPRFYDWGDAVLAHPFASMLVLEQAMGLEGAQLRRLHAAYLEPFRGLGSPAELLDTLRLACRVGRIARALTWARAVRFGWPSAVSDAWARAPLDTMAELLHAEP